MNLNFLMTMHAEIKKTKPVHCTLTRYMYIYTCTVSGLFSAENISEYAHSLVQFNVAHDYMGTPKCTCILYLEAAVQGRRNCREFTSFL
jgi:hypothetical protein